MAFPLFTVVGALFGVKVGFKSIKYFIDSTFRAKVTPVEGSVLYSDLWIGAEHSGIYVGNGEISNIEVTGMAQSEVRLCGPGSFTSKSTLGRKIYVSCNGDGAVGHPLVAQEAYNYIGESSVYGLVIKNCHAFSNACVEQAQKERSWHDTLRDFAESALSIAAGWKRYLLTKMAHDRFVTGGFESLKKNAQRHLGATKWRLWDWDGNIAENPPPEPDWQGHNDFFQNMLLDTQSIEFIRAELESVHAYEKEIADENIPQHIRTRLSEFRTNLEDISAVYENAKDFLAACPDAGFTYNDLKTSNDDLAALAKTLQNNTKIKELVRKMGRNYISEEKKKRSKIPLASKSEVHGTHRSDDLMRLLPSELVNLEDDTLETLFYARLLERNLQTYELQGITFINGETTEEAKKRIGPVVACLDTSGSMSGAPILKAKALLLAIASILKQENRSLHVLLFGSNGEIRDFTMDTKNSSAGLLRFLQQSFGGGTDFETPLQRALDIITEQENYKKADVLMISDGDCALSDEFTQRLQAKKQTLDCSIYSVLCAGSRVEDKFSDEVVVL